MTAINIIVHSSAVHVLTDGAYFEQGRFAGAIAKVTPLAHLNAVVAVTGPALHGALIAAELGSAASYDELKAGAVEKLRAWHERTCAALAEKVVDPRFALVIAGISETMGSDAYLIHADDRFPIEPWTLHQVGPVMLIPGDGETHGEFARAFEGRATGDEFDPARDGLTILEMQRRNKTFGIGAFAQLTTVSREGISTRIIHRWAFTPDARIDHVA